MQAGKIHRISVSRSDAVGPGPGAGLIKDGIKCVTWKADEGDEGLIDFEATALREGAALHKLLKAELANIGVSLVPLMLVQVDSKDKSVERAKEKLLALGFTEPQIAVHTAAEPDAGLLALANDESREVLIFKMAVALGFDAPRAWTLVSMRAARDPDFGVQLVGRILRVHRRLQGRAVPELLRIGYVLLADAESQTGIDAAGQRINRLQTEYAKYSTTTVVVRVGNQNQVQVVGPDGQTTFLPVPPPGAIWTPPPGDAAAVPAATGAQPNLFAVGPAMPSTGQARGEGPLVVGLPLPVSAGYRYPLRPDVPRQFKTQDLPPDFDATEVDCAAKFVLSADNLHDILLRHDKVKVQKRTLEIFSRMVQTELAFAAPSPEQMQQLAQRELLRSGIYHPKVLRLLLLQRLQAALAERGVEDATDSKRLAEYLDVLLATHPELLREAQRKALLEGAVIQEAGPLPGEMVSDGPLPASARNVYGATPPGLNTWERDFGGLLDSNGGGIVLWWHRNPSQKPWSIRVLLDDGRGFYPDFIVGIQNRKTDRSGLLADTKYAYDTNKELPKILAAHESYGRVLILSKNQRQQWAIARMEASGKAVLGHAFSLAEAVNY
jgi:hypothetical protein